MSLEGEFRGIAYDDDHAYSLIGRARYTIIKGLFIAGGYRYDAVDFDEDDVDMDVTVQGPCLEVGYTF